jgi:DUF218 domain
MRINFPAFFHKKTVIVPTWRGWLFFLAVSISLLAFYVKFIVPFLQPTERIRDADFLVVEGWMHSYALEAAKAEFDRGNYRYLVTTGAPYQFGYYLTEYPSLAHVLAASFQKIGVDSSKIITVPCPIVNKDRTYISALYFKYWMKENGFGNAKLNVCSSGAHARRSWFLYRKAIGNDSQVGIICISEEGYNQDNWWKSSYGVKAVIGETIYNIYTYLFFGMTDGSSE